MHPRSTVWAAMPQQARGIVLVVAASVCFATMHLMIRTVSSDLHAFEITFFRNFLGLLVFLPALWRHGTRPLRTRAWPLLSLRAVLNATAMLMFFYSLTVTPLAQVTAIWFSAPIFAALLAMLFLRETFFVRRWVALLAGFIGTVMIVRPGLADFDLGVALAVVSAFLFGCTMTVVKILGRTESSVTITAYMNLMLAGLTLVPALAVWRWPQGDLWLWLIAIGAAGTLAQFAVAQALKETDTSFIVPFTFLQLIWASLYGYVFFDETPHLFIWIGAGMIIAATSYMAYRENRLKPHAKARDGVISG